MKSFVTTIALMCGVAPGVAFGQQVMFGQGWKEQRFSMFSSNDYGLNGETLKVSSDETVSLLWTQLPESLWDKRDVSWDWSVSQSVPPTDLTLKGGDDRNLSLYFVFLPPDAAEAAQGRGVRSLLNDENARVMVYVWGGDHERGDFLESPYIGDRGRTIIRQSAGTGSASEAVDLAADHRRAFGEEAGSLVGLAVSSDSDDTGTGVKAELSRLRFQ